MSTALLQALGELLIRHNVTVVADGDWARLPQQRLKMRAEAFDWKKHGNSLQLDVHLVLGPGKTIVESFGGFGETQEAALADGMNNFVASSFHVMLAAFCPDVQTDHATQEDWMIGGSPKRVTIGNPTMRGRVWTGRTVMPLIDHFESLIRERHLEAGTHWVRLFYSRAGGRVLCDTLIDNEHDAKLEAAVTSMAWPPSDEYYSARIFLIIQDPGPDLHRLLAVICDSRDRTDEQITAELEKLGISAGEADRYLSLVPLAFGRVLLGDAIRFREQAFVRDERTGAVREIDLRTQSVFVEARRIAASGTLTREEFEALALRSSEVNAINNALRAGSKLEDLELSPPVLMWRSDRAPVSDKPIMSGKPKPWWKVW